MKTFNENRNEVEDFMIEYISKHLDAIELGFDNIGLDENYNEYCEKLLNPDFEIEENFGTKVTARVNGSTILSVELEKNYLDEFVIYESNL